jgi:hypothetical protein
LISGDNSTFENLFFDLSAQQNQETPPQQTVSFILQQNSKLDRFFLSHHLHYQFFHPNQLMLPQ